MKIGDKRDGLAEPIRLAARGPRRALAVTAWRRALVYTTAALVPVTGLLVPPLVTPAVAVTPGVGFTADPLSTYQLNGIGWAVAQARGVV